MKKMAFVDLTNFKDWPAGGMLQYELAILPFLEKTYDIDIWGVSVDGVINDCIEINGEKHKINIFGNVKTNKKIIPNYWRGMSIYAKRKQFMSAYDVVYVHTGSCAVILSFLLDRRKTKLVYHQHGLSHLHDYALISLIQRPFVNYAQFRADMVFVVSDDESVRQYAKLMEKKCHTSFLPVKSPIDLSLFNVNKRIDYLKNKNKLENIIYTGRLDSHKDVGILVDMFKIYLEHNKSATFTLIGDGEKRKEIEQKIVKCGLNENVKLLGALSRKQVLEHLRNNDVYVTASIGEGVSVSVLEAYATGMPVVCFNVPGLNKQVVDGVTGYVVKRRTPNDMANAVIALENHWKEFSINSMEHVRNYDADVVSKYISENIDAQISQ